MHCLLSVISTLIDFGYTHVQKQNGMHGGTYTPLLQLLIQNVLTYFSLVF
jgi:hypothetical protein